MNAPVLMFFEQARAAAGLAEAVASWDECAVLIGGADAGVAAVLDRAERGLSARRVRCVRVRCPPSGGLALRDFIAQVAGRAGPGAFTDGDLAAGFAALTEPGEGYDRVALLVEGAHGLLPPAVRYLQLACRSGPRLRVVLAGRPGLDAAWAGDEFASLRGRITSRLELPGPAADDPVSRALVPAAPDPVARVPAGGRRAEPRMLAGLSLAAALVAWPAGRSDAPATPVAVAQADAPAPARAHAESGMPAATALQSSSETPTSPAPPNGLPEDTAPSRAERPVAAVQERTTAPAESSEPATARALEAAPASAAPSQPGQAVGDGLPVLPSPPHAAQGEAERAAAALVAAAAPAGRADEQRCRAIVLRILSGEASPDADKQFLRAGCQAR